MTKWESREPPELYLSPNEIKFSLGLFSFAVFAALTYACTCVLLIVYVLAQFFCVSYVDRVGPPLAIYAGSSYCHIDAPV